MFIHLHNHSHYSLLDGLPKIDEYIQKCLEFKMPAMALTDHGAMYGLIEFYQKAKQAGIKPILGMETYIAPRRLIYKKPKIDASPSHLLLLAKDNNGYKNLIELSSIAQLDGFYYKPRVDKETLKKYSAGIIAASSCWAGEIPRALQKNDFDQAKELVREYQEIFGKDNFYLELVDLGDKITGQTELHEQLISLSKKTKAQLIASKDTHYINPEDGEAQEALLCINTGSTLDKEDRLSMKGMDCSFAHPKIMTERFKDSPDAIENTQEIANHCHVNLDLGKWYFPTVELPQDKTADEVLRENSEKGLSLKISERSKDSELAEEPKLPKIPNQYYDRLNYELEIIKKKSYAPYFLVVADIINWARSQGIVITTRGSAAGSLVSYAIGIINIDPMFFKLPFERFLNPSRPSPPDIDIDFADNRREEVINYVTEKYGEDKVAQICTFGTMMARGSIRDVTRVLGLAYEFGDKLAKMIPFGNQGFPMTIDKALSINPELKNFYETSQDAKQVIDLAKKIEGCARHASIHAAGVLIAPTKITNFVPLQRDPQGRKKITQYDMHSSEAVGLLKLDFLGITNLSIMGEAVKLIKKTKETHINLEKIQLDDKKTFEMLAKGQTTGLFQLSGSGMTKYLVDLKPSSIFDIMAMVALYRPGPMESIPEFITRKHNPSLVSYLDERLKDILEMSYGIITYQDDVLLIAIKLAGYSWEDADKFRKAMGKKIPIEMKAQEEKFKNGCLKNGLSHAKAEKLWELITPFAAYGFNKAHAASYGMVAYQTAYLKANFPTEYMTALLTLESGNEEKIAENILECQKIGIKILPPDVNESRKEFTYLKDNEIRFGLLAIKNLGEDIITTIINERRKNGKFKLLENFLSRITSKNLNKKSLESLAKAGALDCLIERNKIIQNIDRILNYLKSIKKTNRSNQTSLFSLMEKHDANGKNILPLNLPQTIPADLKLKLAWEKELLGLYVSSHPFSNFSQKLNGKITPLSYIKQKNVKGKIISAGIISRTKQIFTKNNELMLFATLEDSSTQIEVVVFPSALKKNQNVWTEDTIVIFTGRMSDRNDNAKILADSAFKLDMENLDQILEQAKKEINKNNNYFKNNINRAQDNVETPRRGVSTNKNNPPQQICIHLPKFFNSEIHNQVKQILLKYPGENSVLITINQQGVLRKIKTEYKIKFDETVKIQIEKITGKGSVNVY